MTLRDSTAPKTQEWQHALLRTVTSLILFETLSGLAIWLLPFSVSAQMMVILHTIAGVALTVPFLWYQWRHWRIRRVFRISHVVLTGYFAMIAALMLVVSGLVLTVQAIATPRIGRVWDLVHIVATFALVASVLPHVVTLLLRAARTPDAATSPVRLASRRYVRASSVLAAACFVPGVVATAVHRPPKLVNELPADYSYVFGKDRPFAPSLARTASGGAYDERSLAGSSSCGRAGCHQAIYEEWSVSAHRYAAMDPAFQKVQEVMGDQNGPESTRYCGGCHDPISLFAGTKNIFTKDLTNLRGYKEGVSCVACHAIKKTDVKGNAAYVMTQPERYIFELDDSSGVKRTVSDFLIRAYPRQHVSSLQHDLFKSPEFCAACHKQFIDQEINRVGWVQLQNQFDNWRKSRWNHPGDPKKTIECRECHMPLLASSDDSHGDARDYNRTPSDGKHRSHRFLGANQFIPKLLDLPGASEHVKLTERWLRGDLAVPEIADKWRAGPAVPLELVAPATARPGEPITLQVQITNNKVGHDFPTGPLDIIQAWVELTVTDDAGRIVYRTGQRDSSNFIAPGTFMLKAEPIDQYGNLIDRHNLWEMVGVRYRRSVFPGMSDQELFTFHSPSRAALATLREPPRGETTRSLDRSAGFRAPSRGGTLHASAKLMYRKVDQYLLNFLFGKESGITSPITVVSEDSREIRIVGDEERGSR